MSRMLPSSGTSALRC